jgi:tRNA(Ile)-lysidine synthase
MLNVFKDYIARHHLIAPDDKIILAVSGGIDSVVLLDLINMLPNNCSLAHCNFGLRGKESDDDQIFVEHLADKYGMDCYVKKFQTKQYANDKKISVQMAARELRYNWFEELRKELHHQYICTAHNLNDVVETFFINLIRGTGLHGLSGIRPKSDNLIRPLLFASRADIEIYSNEYSLSYREDSSNREDKYMRNFIRHRIIPQFEEMNSSFIRKMEENIEILNKLSKVVEKQTEHFKSSCLSKENEITKINIKGITEENITPEILFEILYGYGFNYSTVKNIYRSLDKEPGKIFDSESYRLLKDRDYLFISPKNKSQKEVFMIHENNRFHHEKMQLKFEKITRKSLKSIPKDSKFAALDLDKITYPLKLRRWEEGDYFYPLGMNHKKKLSDFFIDNKVPLFDKQNTWLLISKEEIIWIVGKRIDDRYKITQETVNVLLIEFREEK